jgi:hypothetical protein
MSFYVLLQALLDPIGLNIYVSPRGIPSIECDS